MMKTDEVLEETSGTIPTGTYVERLVKHEDGAIVARGDLSDDDLAKMADVHQYNMSEVRTTNPAHTWKLLNHDNFEPSLYRCTFTSTDIAPDDGFDYSIGFLPADTLQEDSIIVDDILGVNGRIPGTPSEAMETLRQIGVGDVLETKEDRYL